MLTTPSCNLAQSLVDEEAATTREVERVTKQAVDMRAEVADKLKALRVDPALVPPDQPWVHFPWHGACEATPIESRLLSADRRVLCARARRRAASTRRDGRQPQSGHRESRP